MASSDAAWTMSVLAVTTAITTAFVGCEAEPTQADRLAEQVVIAGMPRYLVREVPSGGSGDYPPSAEAFYFGSPPGRITVTAPGFDIRYAVNPVDRPARTTIRADLQPGTIDVATGHGPDAYFLSVTRYSRSEPLEPWLNLTDSQRAAIRDGSATLVETAVNCVE